MKTFDYVRPRTVEEASALAEEGGSAFLAGGTTQVDLMRQRVLTPTRLIDLQDLPLRGVEHTGTGIRVGALVSMEELACHPAVVEHQPLVAQALLAGASPQLRHAATIGGNLLQRTRCGYYRDPSVAACNRRTEGSGCAALGGNHAGHAVLGTSDSCIATHPSDLAVALVALDATATLRGVEGERTLLVRDLYRLPGSTPHLEHDLRPGELITGITLPVLPHGTRTSYLKVRHRASYEFALASCAAAVTLVDGVVDRVHLAIGGVATVPWKCDAGEAILRGGPYTADSIDRAAAAAVDGAVPRADNGYKVVLARNTTRRTLDDLRSGQ
ncbi:MAG: xanthine dehydrogenase family protein subunit M [Umezawaea sp.]